MVIQVCIFEEQVILLPFTFHFSMIGQENVYCFLKQGIIKARDYNENSIIKAWAVIKMSY